MGGLIRNQKPKHVLVVGSKHGYIPATCALACKHNRSGFVDFVDAGFDQNNPGDKVKAWGGVGIWKRIDSNKHFKKFNLNKRIAVYVTTTEKFRNKFPNKRWEYIYIDGDHSYAGVKADFRRFWPLLTKDGIFSFHDIHVDKKEGTKYGVKKFWKELKVRKKYKMLEFSGKFGLGLIQK